MSRRVRTLKYFATGILGIFLASILSLLLGPAVGPLAVYAQAASPTAGPAETTIEADSPKKPDQLRPFEDVTTGLSKQEGVFTTYSDLATGKAYLAIRPNQINQNFLLATTLESGLGEAGLFRGWPVNDLLIQFREVPGDRLEVVVPNTYIRDPHGPNWQRQLLETSFSDSVIFAVNVVSVDPETQAKLIDLSNLVLEKDIADLTQALSWAIGGYSRNSELSRLTKVDSFPENLEIGTVIGFSGGGALDPFASLFGVALRSLPDSRGFSLNLRYSFSALPERTGYRPRAADERVGYFLTAFRAPSQVGRIDPFVRYINRWHLEKQQPEAELSPPKEPIVFWIENTVPPAYRQALINGALMWNSAFAAAGFENAIEVHQMPDRVDWDPADVRYNVIRWSDSLTPWAIGLGPSRVNPLTGEILDADIVIDANTVRFLERQYRVWGLDSAPESEAYLQLCGQRSQAWYLQWQAIQQHGEAGLAMAENLPAELIAHSSHQLPDDYCAGYLNGQQSAFGALALSVLDSPGLAEQSLDAYIQQYLTALTAHEVGHTLGLRHNFAGSRFLTPEELSSPEAIQTKGLISSVMDYFPPNVARPGEAQGDYFPTRLGPYDIWAIQYGYQTTPNPLRRNEQQLLNQIVARSEAPELAYATDEDIFDFIDPEVNAWDLSDDPLQFAEWQLENAQAVWQRLDRLSVSPREGYGSLRRRVDLVFGYFGRNTLTLTNYIGGQRFRRLRPWDSHGQTPLDPVSAEKQREALSALNRHVFAPDAFEFSPQLLNQLAPDRWRHRGASFTGAQLDYPIYERILRVQSLALSNLMLSERLARVRDIEFKTHQEDVLTLTELFGSLYQSIWAEVAVPGEGAPAMSSLRRGLQRHHLNTLSSLVLRRTFWDALSAQSFTDFMALVSTLGAPEDARVLARYQLREISQDVESALAQYDGKMELTTQAHLEDVRDRIARVLNAPVLGL